MNWKGWALEVGIRLVLPLAATVLTLALFRAPWSAPGAGRLRASVAVAAWLLSRLAFAAVFYGAALVHPVPDFGCWVTWHAEPVLATGLPGLVLSDGSVAGGQGYGPLLPYLQAGGMWLVGHPAGVLLPFLAGDAVVLWAGSRLARDRGGEEAERWMCGWLLLSPLLWHQAVVHAQDEPLFAGFLLAGVLLLHRGRDVAGAVVLALGLCATKVTFGLYGAAAALALLPDRRRFARTAVVGVATAAAVCGLAAAAGVGFFRYTVDRHLASKGATGGSLLDDLLSAGALDAGTHAALVPWMAAAVVLGVAAAALRGRTGPYLPRAVALVAVAHALFTLLLPGALPGYAGQGAAILALLLLVARRSPGASALAIALPGLALAVALGQRTDAWAPGLVPAIDVAFKALSAAVALLALRLALPRIGEPPAAAPPSRPSL